MKVLVTVGIFPPDIGGPATFVPKIAKYFQDELKYEIEILTLSDHINLNVKDELSVERINRNLPIIYRWIKTIFTIYKLGKNKDLNLMPLSNKDSLLKNLVTCEAKPPIEPSSTVTSVSCSIASCFINFVSSGLQNLASATVVDNPLALNMSAACIHS